MSFADKYKGENFMDLPSMRNPQTMKYGADSVKAAIVRATFHIMRNAKPGEFTPLYGLSGGISRLVWETEYDNLEPSDENLIKNVRGEMRKDRIIVTDSLPGQKQKRGAKPGPNWGRLEEFLMKNPRWGVGDSVRLNTIATFNHGPEPMMKALKHFGKDWVLMGNLEESDLDREIPIEMLTTMYKNGTLIWSPYKKTVKGAISFDDMMAEVDLQFSDPEGEEL